LILGLFSLRNLELKETLQLLIGVLAPVYFLGVYFFYQGDLTQLSSHYFGSVSLPWSGTELGLITLLKPMIVIVSSVLLILYSTALTKKKKFDAIKKIELCYWMLLLTLPSIFFLNQISECHLLICSIPVAILGGLILEAKPNKVIKEFAFLIAIAIVLAFQLQVI